MESILKKLITILFIFSVFVSVSQTTQKRDWYPDGSYSWLIGIADTSGIHLQKFDVFIQDQTTPPFHYFLMREDKTDIELQDTLTIGDTTIQLESGHGFTAGGEFITIMEGDNYLQERVKTVTADTISIATPIANAFTPEATVIRGVIDMNVDADTVFQEFKFNMRNSTIPIDIKYAIITMQHGSAPDDVKFGDLTILNNGIYFRKQNSGIINLGTYCCNQDFREYGADIEYTDKAGNSNYATNVIFDIINIYGVVIRIDPRNGDIFKATVRDDLSSLVRLRVSLMGQYTQGE